MRLETPAEVRQLLRAYPPQQIYIDGVRLYNVASIASITAQGGWHTCTVVKYDPLQPTRRHDVRPLDRYRGHVIVKNETGRWVYEDGILVSADPDRACGHCGKPNTPEGHDACLGTIPGAINACCGHGSPGEAYVQFEVDPDAT